MDQDNNNDFYSSEGKVEPSKAESYATTSMILGIISLALAVLFEFSAILALACGIVGLVFAIKSKKQGCNNGQRTAGFVCSLIGVILNGLGLVLCIVLFGSALGMFWCFF
ncbi:MAG: hypothetical protein PHO44_07235 [Sphaerochaetaceae bacterium]|jgi:hypothetical protein|nr:hypothetical protein [Sphaerochaetaceae bacterium]MDD4007758.1 hypothetical protein [Sphaerochaetaceae bacterium]MDD4396835.1 hypothetical protein [Sphaerochaetaceae bacterium]